MNEHEIRELENEIDVLQANLNIAKAKLAAARPKGPNAVERFVREHLRFDPGCLHVVTFKEFRERFLLSITPRERLEWNKVSISRAIPEPFTTGTGSGNVTYVLRAAWVLSAS